MFFSLSAPFPYAAAELFFLYLTLFLAKFFLFEINTLAFIKLSVFIFLIIISFVLIFYSFYNLFSFLFFCVFNFVLFSHLYFARILFFRCFMLAVFRPCFCRVFSWHGVPVRTKNLPRAPLHFGVPL